MTRDRGTAEAEDEGWDEGPARSSAPRPVPTADDLPAPPVSDPPATAAGSAMPRTALIGLFVLALLGALYFARAVILPLLLALLLSLLLAPVVRMLRHLRIPRWIASAMVVLGLVASVGTLGYYLASPAADWMDRAPRSLARLEAKVRQIKEPVEKVSRATEQVERMTDVGGRKAQEVKVANQSLSGDLVDMTVAAVSAIAVMLVLLYFLLTSGDLFLRKVAGLVPGGDGKHKLISIARRLERDISTYLLTITLINICLGVAVGLALWWLDMPNPALWGTMACLLNFIPYLGAMVGVAVVAIVALLTFDAATTAIVPPLVYLALTGIEGSFITPTILGSRLTLNPLMIFAGIIFWGWMWGAVGALLAVPLLASAKIVCDHVERLKPIGDLLGR